MEQREFERLMSALKGFMDCEPAHFLLVIADKKKCLVGSSCPGITGGSNEMRSIITALKNELDKDMSEGNLKCH